ncbi:hypothetical protein ACIPC1_30210 [Streptomyces sp. NPDC087263]|uniref:hypothetical protein n=1 Tax=Streptomyces sp. NPDC087263 TaxID=3365773 RepID=UPI003819D1FF
MKRTLASLGAAAVLAAGALALTPGSAAAADGCWGNAGQKQAFGKTYTARYCHNYQGDVVGVYETDTGYLYSGDNWFVCQVQYGENAPVGDAKNNWWLWTQGDDVYSDGGWGWFPANKVSGGNNYEPIPGLATC